MGDPCMSFEEGIAILAGEVSVTLTENYRRQRVKRDF